MTHARPMHRRIALIWNIVTCAVIVAVALFVAVRTASPTAVVIGAIVLVVLAFLLRRYRHVERMPRSKVTPTRDER